MSSGGDFKPLSRSHLAVPHDWREGTLRRELGAWMFTYFLDLAGLACRSKEGELVRLRSGEYFHIKWGQVVTNPRQLAREFPGGPTARQWERAIKLGVSLGEVSAKVMPRRTDGTLLGFLALGEDRARLPVPVGSNVRGADAGQQNQPVSYCGGAVPGGCGGDEEGDRRGNYGAAASQSNEALSRSDGAGSGAGAGTTEGAEIERQETTTEKKGRREEGKKSPSPLAEARAAGAVEVIEYLNDQTGRRFNTNSKSTLKDAEARLRDGLSVDDLTAIIDSKTAEWGSDDRMARHLKPSTLFRKSNAEKYRDEIQAGPPVVKRAPDTPNMSLGRNTSASQEWCAWCGHSEERHPGKGDCVSMSCRCLGFTTAAACSGCGHDRASHMAKDLFSRKAGPRELECIAEGCDCDEFTSAPVAAATEAAS